MCKTTKDSEQDLRQCHIKLIATMRNIHFRQKITLTAKGEQMQNNGAKVAGGEEEDWKQSQKVKIWDKERNWEKIHTCDIIISS